MLNQHDTIIKVSGDEAVVHIGELNIKSSIMYIYEDDLPLFKNRIVLKGFTKSKLVDAAPSLADALSSVADTSNLFIIIPFINAPGRTSGKGILQRISRVINNTEEGLVILNGTAFPDTSLFIGGDEVDVACKKCPRYSEDEPCPDFFPSTHLVCYLNIEDIEDNGEEEKVVILDVDLDNEGGIVYEVAQN